MHKGGEGAGQSHSGPISKIPPSELAFNVVRAIGAVVARFVHTEEVTGSNPVSPTNEMVCSADSAGRAILLSTVV
jgi:hypothetical protein